MPASKQTLKSIKITVFWDVAPCSLVKISLKMEAVRTAELSVHFNQTTQHNIPEESSPYSLTPNLKSHNEIH
jgi:hypothetical protein